MKAVLFDIDDTLCDDTASTLLAIAEVGRVSSARLATLDIDALRVAFLRVAEDYWTRQIQLIGPEPLADARVRLWKSAFEAVGITPPATLIDDAVACYAQHRSTPPALYDDVLPTLERLRADGFALGLVTNGLSETHVEKVAKLGIGHHFGVFLMPDQTGFAKPDIRQFHLACSLLGVEPHRTAHVGDSLISDVGGAHSAGLRAIWYNPAGKTLPDGHIAPFATITALAEIHDHLHA